ncbi:hypothetical protein [Snodgrassella communis]|uniref:hypothetical protein n=1 Tax=Snodgrassella communis TaxID=2946699 RepID=UPI0011861778|nr:hypothetical protein [Snodgrassella communis]
MDKKEFSFAVKNIAESLKNKIQKDEQFLAIFLGKYLLQAAHNKSQISWSDLIAWISAESEALSHNISGEQAKTLQNFLSSIAAASATSIATASDAVKSNDLNKLKK